MATRQWPPAATSAPRSDASARPARRGTQLQLVRRPAGWIWLVIVLLPIYWIVITSFKTQGDYFATNPFAPPSDPTLDELPAGHRVRLRAVLRQQRHRHGRRRRPRGAGLLHGGLRDHPRRRRWFLRGVNGMFLMGLAIPLQATIIPVYLMIIRLQLYDSLLALILPSIAFAIPLSVLVLTNFIRDVPKELFESMRVDGASEWAMLWRLAFPLTRPALLTVRSTTAWPSGTDFCSPSS